MATYYSTSKGGSGYQAQTGNIVQCAGAVWEIGTTALAANDILAGVVVPANAVILGVTLTCADCDSGAGLVLDVGDSGDTDRLIDGATVGQAGGTSVALVTSTGCGYKYTAATAINVLAQVAAAGAPSAGRVALEVRYVVVEP